MLIFDKDTNAMSIVAKDTGDFVISIDNYLFKFVNYTFII